LSQGDGAPCLACMACMECMAGGIAAGGGIAPRACPTTGRSPPLSPPPSPTGRLAPPGVLFEGSGIGMGRNEAVLEALLQPPACPPDGPPVFLPGCSRSLFPILPVKEEEGTAPLPGIPFFFWMVGTRMVATAIPAPQPLIPATVPAPEEPAGLGPRVKGE